ncbi:MAG TPA: hypothetical protein DCF61_02630 [Alphaproteobacteria bacterium]|nr:hypothetical protein [Alphaproteobacteria bacterium]HAM46177.1 hypothetical protein [Alphaproteobacteria bacterium]
MGQKYGLLSGEKTAHSCRCALHILIIDPARANNRSYVRLLCLRLGAAAWRHMSCVMIVKKNPALRIVVGVGGLTLKSASGRV